MKKKRLIPIVLLKDGWIVQSKNFSRYQNIGNPITSVKRLSEWGSDELIYLDISRSDKYDLRRDDQGYENRKTFLEIIEDVSVNCFMPITVGGKITSLSDIEQRLRAGADKVCINSAAVKDRNFVTYAAREFGSQCIVVSLDVKQLDKKYFIHINGGKDPTELELGDLALEMQERGAGELLINSIDRDGMGIGYDHEIYNIVHKLVNIPIIACGGVGEYSDFSNLLEKVDVDAVAAANIFHYRDQAVYLAKQHLFKRGFRFRKPEILKLNQKKKH
ncbi:imidazole glycerol phosphate synthase cyclase subunit [Amylibacter sp.]|nr:imidazole glycerol phosphate synthase cyclase subunit [Amylibacter sp.]